MKIFGIGLSKTGTKSLCKALEYLGYTCNHCPKYEARQGHVKIHPGELDFDAILDIPVAATYKKLYSKYPSSLFILTTRNVAEWIDSCEAHFDYDIKPLERALLNEIYGTPVFNQKKFLAAWDAHILDVISFFTYASALSQLLILDLGHKNKMGLVSAFLSESGNYPHEGKRK